MFHEQVKNQSIVAIIAARLVIFPLPVATKNAAWKNTRPCAPVPLETPAQRGRQPHARYEIKREMKAMYPMINAVWYFAAP